jgi:hypothetical protein
VVSGATALADNAYGMDAAILSLRWNWLVMAALRSRQVWLVTDCGTIRLPDRPKNLRLAPRLSKTAARMK